MNVEQMMTSSVKTCQANDSMSCAAQIMWEEDCGAVPVVDDDGKPIAMITDRDICISGFWQGKALWEIPVSSAMSQTIVTCKKSEPIAVAESLMRGQQVHRLPIVDDAGRLVGILSLNDLATRGHLKKKSGMMHGALGADAIAGTLAAICERRDSRQAAE